MTKAVKVTEINQIDNLAPLAPQWRDLLRETSHGSFFQSLEWLQAYWEHYGEDQRLRVLVVEEGGDVTGIVPLAVVPEMTRVGKVYSLTYPLHDWGWSYGPIGRDPSGALEAALEHVRETPRDWETLDLRWAGPGNSLEEITQQAMQKKGFQGIGNTWCETAYVDLSDGWDAYWKTRPTKVRNNHSRQYRRSEELGDLQYIRYRPRGLEYGDGDPNWEMYDGAVELASRTWQGASETGTTLSHDSVADFFRQTHRLAAEAGALDMNMLKLDGEPVAFGYNYHAHGYVFGLRIGYSPDHPKVGLGNALYMNMFRDGAERGDHTFDMGPGTLERKRHLMTGRRAVRHFVHYPVLSPRVQLLRVKRWWKCRQEASVARKTAV